MKCHQLEFKGQMIERGNSAKKNEDMIYGLRFHFYFSSFEIKIVIPQPSTMIHLLQSKRLI